MNGDRLAQWIGRAAAWVVDLPMTVLVTLYRLSRGSDRPPPRQRDGSQNGGVA